MFKVLLVDDEPSVIQGLKNLVPWNELGYEVYACAYNGEDALDAVRKEPIDLVITDIKMPVFDGLQFIRIAVNELKTKAHFIILSGYDEFSYVKEALKYNVKDYILKPVDEDDIIPLLKKLHKQMSDEIASRKERDLELRFIAAETINRLLNGEKKESLLSRASLFINISEEEAFRLVFIEMEDFIELMNDFSGEDLQKKREGILQHIQETLLSESLLYEHDDGHNGLLLFLRDTPKLRKNLKSILTKIQSSVKELFGLLLSIYTSDTHHGLINVEKAYKEVLYAHDYRFFKGKGCCIPFDEVKELPVNNTLCDIFPIEVALNDLEANNIHKLKITINSIFKEFSSRMTAPEVIWAHINNLQLSIAKLIVSMNGNMEEFIEKDDWFSYDLNEITLEELRKNVLSFCERACQYIGSLRKRNSSNVIHDVMEYINKNYPENLSLKQLAATFFMNPFYLGQLFKKATGMYFNDYLNVIRIEEAKKLLRRTNMKVYEVAAKVGYTDPDYFFSRFEKLNHISPLKYKKSIIQEEGTTEE